MESDVSQQNCVDNQAVGPAKGDDLLAQVEASGLTGQNQDLHSPSSSSESASSSTPNPTRHRICSLSSCGSSSSPSSMSTTASCSRNCISGSISNNNNNSLPKEVTEEELELLKKLEAANRSVFETLSSLRAIHM